MNIGLSKLKPERLLSPSPGQRPGFKMSSTFLRPVRAKYFIMPKQNSDIRELITESRLHLHKIVDSAFVYKNSALTGRNANQMYIPGVLPRAWR